jgi:hypothetical protein
VPVRPVGLRHEILTAKHAHRLAPVIREDHGWTTVA